jgi:hypothetical protein
MASAVAQLPGQPPAGSESRTRTTFSGPRSVHPRKTLGAWKRTLGLPAASTRTPRSLPPPRSGTAQPQRRRYCPSSHPSQKRHTRRFSGSDAPLGHMTPRKLKRGNRPDFPPSFIQRFSRSLAIYPIQLLPSGLLDERRRWLTHAKLDNARGLEDAVRSTLEEAHSDGNRLPANVSRTLPCQPTPVPLSVSGPV